MTLRIFAFGIGLLGGVAAVTAGYHYTGDEYVAAVDARFEPAVVEVRSEAWLDSLTDAGARILRRRGDLALAYLPIRRDSVSPESPSRLRREDGLRQSPRRVIRPVLHKAMEWYGAGRVFSGEGLPQGYDGGGVVVGICDIGIDPLHPTFIDAGSGESRIRRIVQYKESQGERIEVCPDDYSAWKTDTVVEWHATHVAGIMAGGGAGSPYRGVAHGAEIVVTTSQLSDVGLLAGVEDIIEYARSVGKPAVVNLSMGSYNGPHDGTSLFSRYMDMLGEEAVICLSAGNEGNRSNTLRFDFRDGHEFAEMWIGSRDYANYDIYGMTDIWGLDGAPFGIELFVYDSNDGTRGTKYLMPRLELADGGVWRVDSGSDSELAKYFKGGIEVRGGIWPGNGRRYVQVEYDLHTDEMSNKGRWARYNLGLRVLADMGQHVDIYADGSYSTLRGLAADARPGSTVSFSDLACGHNVVSVGMYNNGGLAEPAGIVSEYSSYGTLVDGRVMPLTVAPGASLVSALSSYADPAPSADHIVEGIWAHQMGTSMSSPYVAGFIATWLQANPALGVGDVKEIIAATNRHDYPDPENPRHGQGWFDPYAGLLKAIEYAGMDDVGAEAMDIRYDMEAQTLTVLSPGGGCTVRIYGLGGVMQTEHRVDDRLSHVSLSELAEGVYIAVATAPDGTSRRLKLLVG